MISKHRISYHVFLLGAFIFFGLGCSTIHNVNKQEEITISEMINPADTLYIADVVLCNVYKLGPDTNYLPIKEDSILNIFKKALSVNNINAVVMQEINYSCQLSIRGENDYFNVPDTSRIYGIATNNQLNHQLIPVIGIVTHDYMFESATRSTSVALYAYIVSNGSIIYARNKLNNAPNIRLTYPADPSNSITQETWNKLVFEVFKDFMEKQVD